MATEHVNGGDGSADEPRGEGGGTTSRWLAPGVLRRARELTEGIETRVEPSPPPEPTRDARAGEWVPAADARADDPAETTGERDTGAAGEEFESFADSRRDAWEPPRRGAPLRASAPPRSLPRVPLSRRLQHLRIRSPSVAPLTRRWIAVAALVVAGAGLVGLVVGLSRGDEQPQRVSTQELSITLPGAWERRPAVNDTTSLELGGAVVAGPAEEPDEGLAAGTLPASATPGLPSLAKPLDPTPPRPDLVRLGRLPAYRYQGLARPGSDRLTTLYVVPRRSDSVAVACFAPRARAASFLADCAAAAATVVPAGGTSAGRRQLERHLTRVRREIAALGRRRAADRRELARAETPRGQAFAAKALARDYRRASASLGRLSGAPTVAAAVRPLQRDLRATARAYRRLAVAAAAQASGDFDAARRAVRRSEAAVERRLAAL